jgi:lysyl-tRNA synthetase, class II
LANKPRVRIAGRIQTIRRMGKAGFLHLMQSGERLQVYVRKDAVPEADYALFEGFDLGDIVGVDGYLFRTRTGELSVHAEKLTFLSKILLAMPEKWHGLEDVEIRYRQRYLDLIANPESQKIFITRARIISSLRHQLEERGFVEVETPMMQPVYGGATARPFVTHHNTLDMDLYLRIAPELYLKRLIVGGLERVYEINRNFRNEGVSTQHNPEFTMLEFYQAYTDYQGLMDLTAELLKQTAIDATGSAVVEYQGTKLDFGNIRRLSMQEAVGNLSLRGHALVEAFERQVEPTLFEPTIIYDYPVEVSPLSKHKRDDPAFVERFEIYAAGMEIGNAYTELNDPKEQCRRFEMQLELKAAGDEEAHQMDEDYLRAMSYGMPPTGGEGIGIDRLTMILTNSKSIRDVILFPLLRPEGEIGIAEKLRGNDV